MPAIFTLTSEDFTDGSELPPPFWGRRVGGEDRSPQLSWAGFPDATESFALTCFDPDAPGGPGWWHWVVTDLPAGVSALAADAGEPGDVALPDGAHAWRNQSGIDGYSGPTPPAGTGLHHYEFTVYALDVPSLTLSAGATFGDLDAALAQHELARATLTGTAAAP